MSSDPLRLIYIHSEYYWELVAVTEMEHESVSIHLLDYTAGATPLDTLTMQN